MKNPTIDFESESLGSRSKLERVFVTNKNAHIMATVQDQGRERNSPGFVIRFALDSPPKFQIESKAGRLLGSILLLE